MPKTPYANLQIVTLDEIDHAVCNNYLRDGCLTINRLSGKNLPMERCFINLGIVDHVRDGDVKGVDDGSDRNSDTGHHLSKFSLDARLKVETPPQAKQVTLQTLFRPRERPDGTTARPNRVMIWGRAGVGKTTLCKKFVYDFIHKRLWSELYDRVLWLPLRRIKLMRNEPSNLGELIREYFSDAFDGQLQAEVLQKLLLNHGDRTLFILDGLDEVSYALDPDTSTGRILHRLLNQDNVIITSRPHSTNILDRRPPDLELETVGFFPEQVEEYLRSETNQTGTLEKTILEIRSFIQTRPLIQSLVRIPIQLDAICYAWDAKDFPKDNVTMTTIYQAIARRLWEKDIVRLDKKSNGERITRQQIQDYPDSKRFVESEVGFLEELAFGGLCNEIVEFNLGHIGKLNTSQRPMLNDGLVHLSFLRSSDNSLHSANRTYHFIHFTFQEFFAAQYLVRQWASGKMISLWKMDSEDSWSFKNAEQITPEDFFRKEKYSTRYDIFWRFVVGLLQMEDHRHLHRFFEVLEGEPRDLLGPTHQRLTIHCLSEIGTAEGSFRFKLRELEDNYRNWISFESSINSSTALMREAECPARIFRSWLEGTSEEKIRVMLALKDRPSMSSDMLDMVICELCKSTDEKVRSAAFQVLGNHCNQISGEKFLEIFLNQNKNMRLMAVRALASSQTLGWPAVEALVRLLQDDDSAVRSDAAGALGGQRTLPERAVQALVRLLQDDHWTVRSDAAGALGGQSTLPERAVEALVRLLQDDDSAVRSDAARALGGQSTLPERAVEALVRLLQDDDSAVRSRAAGALGGQSTLPERAVEALVRLLQDDHWTVRSRAAGALGGQRTLPERAVEALVRLLQDDDSAVRSDAARALGGQRTLPERAVEALVRLLQDDDSAVRSDAAGALGGQRTLPERAVEALVRLLQDDDSAVRSRAAGALGGQPTLPERAVEALVRLLQDDHWTVRSRAAGALGGQPTLPERAVEALVRLLQDDHWAVRPRAAGALRGQRTLPERAVEALVRLLQNDDWAVRSDAAGALRGQSILSESAVKALIPLLQVDISSELAAQILQSHKEFYLLIPTLDPPLLQALLTFWHRQSYYTSTTCFIWKGSLLINRQGKVQNVPLKKEQQEKIEHAYLKTQKALGIPLPIAWA